MLETHFSSFVEEDGELSFSVLSRTVLQDSHKSSFHTLNNAFKAQSLHLKATASLTKEFGCTEFSRSLHSNINRTDSEVVCLQVFLLQHINQLRDNIFNPYPPLGNSNFYKSQKEVLQDMALPCHTTHSVGLNSTGASPGGVRCPPKDMCFLSKDLLDKGQSVLASLHRLLLEDNLSGLEVKYVLQPDPLVPGPLVMDVFNYEPVPEPTTHIFEGEAMSLDKWL